MKFYFRQICLFKVILQNTVTCNNFFNCSALFHFLVFSNIFDIICFASILFLRIHCLFYLYHHTIYSMFCSSSLLLYLCFIFAHLFHLILRNLIKIYVVIFSVCVQCGQNDHFCTEHHLRCPHHLQF